nr:MAG TPA: hypothetical protein [Crassvirales sp.]
MLRKLFLLSTQLSIQLGPGLNRGKYSKKK